MRDPIQTAVRRNTCTGCGLCHSLAGDSAVSLEQNPAGFIVAHYNGLRLQKSAYKVILHACPGINVSTPKYFPRSSNLWGNCLCSSTGYATDSSLRYHCSTGGVLSALQRYLLEKQLVEAVISTRANPDNPLLTETTAFSDPSEIFSRAGSRYAPTSPLEDIIKISRRYNSFAFVGRPCDITALRRAAELVPELSGKILYCLSFFCGGVPSRNANEAMLRKMKIDPENLDSLTYRGGGWPGKVIAKDREGNYSEMSYSESWGDILGPSLLGRCKYCPDGIGQHADIACADAWHCDSMGYPVFENSDGINAVLARTPSGLSLFRLAVRDNYIVELNGNLSSHQLELMQPNQAHRRKVVMTRNLAILLTKHFLLSFDISCAIRNAFRTTPLRLARDFVGTTLRSLKKRI